MEREVTKRRKRGGHDGRVPLQRDARSREGAGKKKGERGLEGKERKDGTENRDWRNVAKRGVVKERHVLRKLGGSRGGNKEKKKDRTQSHKEIGNSKR